jgi:hypothetical protein
MNVWPLSSGEAERLNDRLGAIPEWRLSAIGMPKQTFASGSECAAWKFCNARSWRGRTVENSSPASQLAEGPREP